MVLFVFAFVCVRERTFAFINVRIMTYRAAKRIKAYVSLVLGWPTRHFVKGVMLKE